MSRLINYSEDTNRELQGSIKLISTIASITCSLLFLRLFYLQIWQGDTFKDFSDQNRLKKVVLRAPRGFIVDRNNKILVDNTIDFDVSLTPYYVRDPEVRKKTFDLLNSFLHGVDQELAMIDKHFTSYPSFSAIKLKKQITRDELAFIETYRDDLPGVDVDVELKRIYRMRFVGSQLFGHLSEVTKYDVEKENSTYTQGDRKGKLGLEYQYEKFLRGTDGYDYQEIDALGRRRKKDESLFPTLTPKDPIHGNNLVLNVDSKLQEVAFNALGDFKGSVVAIKPDTGAVLAMVSRPSFDPSHFSRGVDSKIYADLINDPLKPFINKAIQDHFPPGSTFKLITALTGLMLKEVSPTTTVNCPGHFSFGNRPFHCHKKQGHGNVNLIQAIEQSCNVFFYKLAARLNIDDINKYATMLGLGSVNGIDLPSEQRGLIPSQLWKQTRFKAPWFPGETLSVAIGQGDVRVTPLQLAMAYGAISHGGEYYQPQIAKRIEDGQGKVIQEFKPAVKQKAFIPENIRDSLLKGLLNVVQGSHGTGKSLKNEFYEVGGKTGTAQAKMLASSAVYDTCENMPFFNRHHGFFVGVSPVKNAEIAVAVFLQHGCRSGEASKVARKVFDAYYGIQPVEPKIGQSPVVGPSPAATNILTPSEQTIKKPVIKKEAKKSKNPNEQST